MSKVAVIKYVKRKKEAIFSAQNYAEMLDAGLKEITGESTVSSAVKKILAGRVIGMKPNCLTGKFNSTPLALADAVTEILKNSGWEENNIIIWERSNRELKNAGYELNISSFGRRCFGTDSNGVGYGRDFYSYGKVSSLISRTLTDIVDCNINLPVLKDHSIAGLSASLKNMYGAIHNPNKYHGDACNPFAADVSNLAPLKKKNKLTVIDAAEVQYHAGPGYNSRYRVQFGGILISIDPVAADRIGLEIVEYYRKTNKMPSLKDAGRPADYLFSAEKTGLGTAEMGNIDLKVLSIDSNGNQTEGGLFDG